MAIHIKIRKVSESNNTGYYEVMSDDFGGGHFFVGMDKTNHTVHYYLTKDFSIPAKTISFKGSEPIGDLQGISSNILGRVAIRALGAFRMDNFPNSLDYAA